MSGLGRGPVLVTLASVVWACLALVLAYHRSIWGDELVRFEHLFLHGVWGAAQAMLREPSPFVPGEALINGFFWKLLSPLGVRLEVWGRIQNVLWGAGTVAIAVALSLRDARFRALPWLVFFSAALMSASTEMRSSASLVFSGAACFWILWCRELNSKALITASALYMVSGHIYGVAFLCAAIIVTPSVRKRFWWIVLIGALTIVFVLSQIKIMTGQGGSGGFPNALSILKQTFGALGNPHKASYVLLPLALWGAFQLIKTREKSWFWVLVFAVGTVAAPLTATIVKKYFFVPRQMLGGAFFFLALTSIGLASTKSMLRAALYVLVAVVTVNAWAKATLFAVPPFPNQPFHRFRKVAEDINAKQIKNVLILDVCNQGVLELYLTLQFEGEPTSARGYTHSSGFPLREVCWRDGTCLTSFMDWRYCTLPAESFAPSESAGKFLETFFRENDLGLVVHTFPTNPPGHDAIPFVRSW